MLRHSWIPLTLSMLVVSGCPAPVAPNQTASPAPMVRKQVASAVVTGKLLAPANIISNDGAGVISNDGASIVKSGGLIISNDGAGVISTGGLNYRTAQQASSATEVRIADAEVFLSADASGSPVPGLPAVKTDKDGRYTLPNVPAGHTLVLVARFKTRDGKNAELRTLLQSSALGNTVHLDAATTLLTAAVLGGQSGGLGEFNASSFTRAVDDTRSQLTLKDLPDWTNPGAVVAKINEILARLSAVEGKVGAIENEIEALKKAMEQNKQDTSALREDLQALQPRSPEPSSTPVPVAPPSSSATSSPAAPVPSAAPSATPSSVPAGAVVYAVTDDFIPGPPGKGPWSYTSYQGTVRKAFLYGDHSDAGDRYYHTDTGATVYYTSTVAAQFPEPRLVVRPDAATDVVISWQAPRAGKVTVSGKAKATDPVPTSQEELAALDGIGVVFGRSAAVTFASTPIGSPVVVQHGQEKTIGSPEAVAVNAGDWVVLRVHAGAKNNGELDTLALSLTYSFVAAP